MTGAAAMKSARPLYMLSTAMLVACASVSFADLPADLRQSAGCISDVLRALPGVEDVALRAGQGTQSRLGELPNHAEAAAPYAVIRYTFLDEAARRHAVEFGLFNDPQIGLTFDSTIASGFSVIENGGP